MIGIAINDHRPAGVMLFAVLLLSGMLRTGGFSVGRILPTNYEHAKSAMLTKPQANIALHLSPRELIEQYDSSMQQGTSPSETKRMARQPIRTIAKSVLCVPLETISEDVVYTLRPTGSQLQGRRTLIKACQTWDETFETNEYDDVQCSLTQISTIANDMVITRWNVTWVPPTAAWLEAVAQAWPSVQPQYCEYTHLAGTVSTFSWRAVARLFVDASRTGYLRIPLACICGTTQHRFRLVETDAWQLTSIVEDLDYAIDLRNGRLQNRKCAEDLKLFLQAGRCMMMDRQEEWDDAVEAALPWRNVPGSNPLDIEPQDDGPAVIIGFLAFVVFALTAFAVVLAPELIGQNLFGPPSYIVPPSELGSVIAY